MPSEKNILFLIPPLVIGILTTLPDEKVVNEKYLKTHEIIRKVRNW